jgi:hypothetical protein
VVFNVWVFTAGHFTARLQLRVGLKLLNAIGGYSSNARRRSRSLRRIVFRRASGAKSAENEFAIANDPFTQGALGRLGHVVPLQVLNISAAVADEVMMQQAFHIESRGAALNRHFTHQARLHQVT